MNTSVQSASHRARTSSIPGPRGLPVLGSVLDFGRDPLGFLTHGARTYGDVAAFRLMNIPAILLSHPDDIEHVLLRTNGQDFEKTPGDSVTQMLFGSGLLTGLGETWLRQRRLAQPAFHRQRITAYGETMVAHTENLLSAWQSGQVRDIHQDMMQVTLEIVAKTLFDADMSGQTHRVGQALKVVMDTFIQVVRNPFLVLPVGLPTPSNLRFRRAVRELDTMIYSLIRQRRAEGGDRGDLLSMLLAARDEDGSQLNDRQLRDEAMTLFLAGHETTAIALSYAWYLLAQNPEAESKLVAELQHALDGRAPTVADLPRLPYAEKVIKEAMRLYPPAWIVDGRIALKATQVRGYPVPKGAYLSMSQWVMHRDPRYFPDPEHFDPDRWDETFTRGLPKYAYFPFGGGPRLCIGNSFAMMEAVLILATIAQRYQLSLVPGQPVVPQPSITLRPKYGVRMMPVIRTDGDKR